MYIAFVTFVIDVRDGNQTIDLKTMFRVFTWLEQYGFDHEFGYDAET